MFRWEKETLAVAHLWAIAYPYEGVSANLGLFASEELAQEFLDSEQDRHGYPVAMALPTVA